MTGDELLHATLLALYDQLQAEYVDPETEQVVGPCRGRELYVQLCQLADRLKALELRA